MHINHFVYNEEEHLPPSSPLIDVVSITPPPSDTDTDGELDSLDFPNIIFAKELDTVAKLTDDRDNAASFDGSGDLVDAEDSATMFDSKNAVSQENESDFHCFSFGDCLESLEDIVSCEENELRGGIEVHTDELNDELERCFDHAIEILQAEYSMQGVDGSDYDFPSPLTEIESIYSDDGRLIIDEDYEEQEEKDESPDDVSTILIDEAPSPKPTNNPPETEELSNIVLDTAELNASTSILTDKGTTSAVEQRAQKSPNLNLPPESATNLAVDLPTVASSTDEELNDLFGDIARIIADEENERNWRYSKTARKDSYIRNSQAPPTNYASNHQNIGLPAGVNAAPTGNFASNSCYPYHQHQYCNPPLCQADPALCRWIIDNFPNVEHSHGSNKSEAIPAVAPAAFSAVAPAAFPPAPPSFLNPYYQPFGPRPVQPDMENFNNNWNYYDAGGMNMARNHATYYTPTPTYPYSGAPIPPPQYHPPSFHQFLELQNYIAMANFNNSVAQNNQRPPTNIYGQYPPVPASQQYQPPAAADVAAPQPNQAASTENNRKRKLDDTPPVTLDMKKVLNAAEHEAMFMCSNEAFLDRLFESQPTAHLNGFLVFSRCLRHRYDRVMFKSQALVTLFETLPQSCKMKLAVQARRLSKFHRHPVERSPSAAEDPAICHLSNPYITAVKS